MNDEFFIRRTFELAKKAQGLTWPNPLVGSVIVKNGKIIGEGFHKKAGTDHAELDALKNSSESLEGATVYVNLEPCCHTHKLTPPCAQRLIQEKVKKVVISNIDPNPAVSGKGIELLQSHGIEVVHGILKEEGEKLNEVFFLSQRLKRPFIHLKLASTLDGKIARPDGESQWITGEEARTHVHVLRSQVQAVMVGGETVRVDHPKLNVRLPDYEGPQPLRVIISHSGNLPPQPENTLVYSSIEEAMKDLFERKIISILLEGGSSLAGSFFKLNLIDRVSLFLNPSFLGLGIPSLGDLGIHSLNERPKLTQVTSNWIGEDLLISGRIQE